MNFEITANMLEEQQKRFESIDNQIADVKDVVTKLTTQKAEEEVKAFYEGKAKAMASISIELTEAEKELKRLKNEREGMLLQPQDTKNTVERIYDLAYKEFNQTINIQILEHVKAINELIDQGNELDTKLSQEMRADVYALRPYLGDESASQLQYSLSYETFSPKMAYVIDKIKRVI